MYVSAASAWEMAIKSPLRKLRVPDDLAAQLQAHRFEELPVSIEHASMVANLPLHHRDPFDWLLIAQASLESLALVTADPRLAAYGEPVVLV